MQVVVAGFRYHKSGPVVGSLLLGLYEGGRLHHVGVSASFSAARRRELLDELAPYREGVADHPWTAGDESTRVPGTPSRWTGKKDISYELLRPELVCEVEYDYFSQGRFRHGSKFLRWRPDKKPRQCTMEQVMTGNDERGTMKDELRTIFK